MVSTERWESPAPIRYPDPNIVALDKRFEPIVLGHAAIERIAGGCRFTEGPVWFGDTRQLLWSDIPNDRIMRYDEETGAVSVFRRPSHYANGNTRDRQGRLITCEMGSQRLTRTEYDGTITVLAEKFDGKPLAGPNDVVVKSDGSIWFSDNGAGIRGNYLGTRERRNCRTACTASMAAPAKWRSRLTTWRGRTALRSPRMKRGSMLSIRRQSQRPRMSMTLSMARRR